MGPGGIRILGSMLQGHVGDLCWGSGPMHPVPGVGASAGRGTPDGGPAQEPRAELCPPRDTATALPPGPLTTSGHSTILTREHFCLGGSWRGCTCSPATAGCWPSSCSDRLGHAVGEVTAGSLPGALPLGQSPRVAWCSRCPVHPHQQPQQR